MCGILGIVQTDGKLVSRRLLENMTSSLAHRGPDGDGMIIRGQVGLGHRRLAIIDLVAGRQPMCNEDEQIWITYNGELYNYRELRQQLQAKGHVFRSNSDTETIIHAYEEWRERCVEHFRGMFAFAVADLKNRKMFLARDHLGIKPLYYISQPNYFAFASEIQALRCLPDQQFTLDLQSIDRYLWLQYIPAPSTAFKEVKKLLPAHRMVVNFDGSVLGPEEYWKLQFSPDCSRSDSQWLDAIDHVLRDSVRTHLVSDVPFGAFLSGGVDSSAVVAYMSQILERPVRTFCIGFDEADYSEITYAEQAAKLWKTEHHVEIVKPDALAILPRLVKHYGEPFGDSSAIPTFYVSQMARQFVPMVLSGDGGDESFAGYDSYRAWMSWLAEDDLDRVHRPTWKRVLRPLAQRILPQRYPPPPSRRPTLHNWLSFISYIDASQRRSLWRPEYQYLPNVSLDTFEREFARAQGYSPGSSVQYMDLKTYLPFDILTKVDVASMMHGLEVRTPLVDIRVIELAATIPEDRSIRRNSVGRWEGKLLLKKALQQYYPAEFLQRPKMGFAVPIQKWFGPDGALHETVLERLCQSNSMVLEFFEPAVIRHLVDWNAAGPIWLLLFLEEWLQQNRPHVGL